MATFERAVVDAKLEQVCAELREALRVAGEEIAVVRRERDQQERIVADLVQQLATQKHLVAVHGADAVAAIIAKMAPATKLLRTVLTTDQAMDQGATRAFLDALELLVATEDILREGCGGCATAKSPARGKVIDLGVRVKPPRRGFYEDVFRTPLPAQPTPEQIETQKLGFSTAELGLPAPVETTADCYAGAHCLADEDDEDVRPPHTPHWHERENTK